MNVVVTGGRNYRDAARVAEVLSKLPITRLSQGGARGADTLAILWAIRNQIEFRTYVAAWAKEGKAAGHLRNQRMLDAELPDLVVAFPGGRGTADCVRRAKAMGIEVLEVSPTPY